MSTARTASSPRPALSRFDIRRSSSYTCEPPWRWTGRSSAHRSAFNLEKADLGVSIGNYADVYQSSGSKHPVAMRLPLRGPHQHPASAAPAAPNGPTFAQGRPFLYGRYRTPSRRHPAGPPYRRGGYGPPGGRPGPGPVAAVALTLTPW